MNIDDIKTLRNTIQSFSKEKQLDIFKMCKSSNIFFTENNNGIFINLTELNNIQLLELQKYVNYIVEQETQIEKVEQEKKEMAKIYISQE